MAIQTEKSLANLLRVIRLTESITVDKLQKFPKRYANFSKNKNIFPGIPQPSPTMFPHRSNFTLIIKVNTILFRVFSSLQTCHPIHTLPYSHSYTGEKKNEPLWKKCRVQRLREKKKPRPLYIFHVFVKTVMLSSVFYDQHKFLSIKWWVLDLLRHCKQIQHFLNIGFVRDKIHLTI
jgi:hypothetical protein